MTVRARLAAWGWAVLAIAVTAWAGNWVAVTIEPNHAGFYLAVIAAFVLSTARPVPRVTA